MSIWKETCACLLTLDGPPFRRFWVIAGSSWREPPIWGNPGNCSNFCVFITREAQTLDCFCSTPFRCYRESDLGVATSDYVGCQSSPGDSCFDADEDCDRRTMDLLDRIRDHIRNEGSTYESFPGREGTCVDCSRVGHVSWACLLYPHWKGPSRHTCTGANSCMCKWFKHEFGSWHESRLFYCPGDVPCCHPLARTCNEVHPDCCDDIILQAANCQVGLERQLCEVPSPNTSCCSCGWCCDAPSFGFCDIGYGEIRDPFSRCHERSDRPCRVQAVNPEYRTPCGHLTASMVVDDDVDYAQSLTVSERELVYLRSEPEPHRIAGHLEKFGADRHVSIPVLCSQPAIEDLALLEDREIRPVDGLFAQAIDDTAGDVDNIILGGYRCGCRLKPC